PAEIADPGDAPGSIGRGLGALQGEALACRDLRAVHRPVDERAVRVAPQNVRFAVAIEITDSGDAPGSVRRRDMALKRDDLARGDLRAVHAPIDKRAVRVVPQNV